MTRCLTAAGFHRRTPKQQDRGGSRDDFIQLPLLRVGENLLCVAKNVVAENARDRIDGLSKQAGQVGCTARKPVLLQRSPALRDDLSQFDLAFRP